MDSAGYGSIEIDLETSRAVVRFDFSRYGWVDEVGGGHEVTNFLAQDSSIVPIERHRRVSSIAAKESQQFGSSFWVEDKNVVFFATHQGDHVDLFASNRVIHESDSKCQHFSAKDTSCGPLVDRTGVGLGMNRDREDGLIVKVVTK